MPRSAAFLACATGKRRAHGFTLIELLVAITIMALLAVLSWRGLDGMARATTQTSQRVDEVLTLQVGLAQWKVDLDALAQTSGISSIDWDGRVLRLTRTTSVTGEGLQVVAWTRRNEDSGKWLRWQSPVLRTASAWGEAWARAAVWGQTPSAEDRAREVFVVPLQDWQIFYFRADAWTNPLSSVGGQLPAAGSNLSVVPEGIRLVLTLPPGPGITGKLTMDWVKPTLSGEKS